MRAAKGRARVFTDVDLPFGLNALPLMVEYILARGYHMVVGDRTLVGSSYALDVGWRRRAASAVFTTIVGRLVTGGFFDTQCGLKAIRADVADEVFRLARIERFAFDVELLYLGLRHRLDIKRVPVSLRNNETSSVRLVRDSMRMLVDVLQIKVHQLRGHYESPLLAGLVARDAAQFAEAIGATAPPPRHDRTPAAAVERRIELPRADEAVSRQGATTREPRAERAETIGAREVPIGSPDGWAADKGPPRPS
jgi:hypothetical protein